MHTKCTVQNTHKNILHAPVNLYNCHTKVTYDQGSLLRLYLDEFKAGQILTETSVNGKL